MDEVRLVLPAEDRFFPVAHLVVSDLAARVDLTLERLDDLVLALDSLLAQRSAGGELTISLRVSDGALQTEIGPFESAELRRELEQDSQPTLGVKRILETTADDVELHERDGASWVRLSKRGGAAA